MQFYQRVSQAMRAHCSLVCVGLDPMMDQLPHCVRSQKQPFFAFNRSIIDHTHDLVCAFKPQAAHYHAVGAEDQLQQTIDYIHTHYPSIPVILDAKRGDIGSTAERYAVEAFERYNADAVTVNPYMGADSIRPFTAYKDRGVIVLCCTSNAHARVVQQFPHADQPLYEHIARCATEQWNENNNLMLVVGATQPEALGRIRSIVQDMTLLVPGLGAQGGDMASVMHYGLNAQNEGMIINSSRGIIYASQGDDFAHQARLATRTLRDQINALRTPV